MVGIAEVLVTSYEGSGRGREWGNLDPGSGLPRGFAALFSMLDLAKAIPTTDAKLERAVILKTPMQSC